MPISRNAPCPCGSGKKYKRCCLEKDSRVPIHETPRELPDVPGDGFLYREGFQCLKMGINPADDSVAIRLGDVVVRLTSKSQRVTVMAGKLEITNQYTANTKSAKHVNLEFEGSTYLTLTYIDKTAEMALSQGKAKCEVILAYLEVALGERLVYDKIYEQVIDLKNKTPIWMSDVTLNPGHFQVTEIEDSSLEMAALQWDFLAGLESLKRDRIGLALRWYHKGLLDKYPDDIFIAFWIAFEVLVMRGTTNLEVGIDCLKTQFGSHKTKKELKDSLMLGHIFDFRCQIIHEGRKVFTNKYDETILLLKNIVSEVLRKEVGLPSSNALSGKI